MSYLIAINETTKEILHPDAVKLFPGFSRLKEDEILFIVLSYDYCSPYAHFAEEERLRRSSLHVWNDNKLDILEKQEIKFAINAYKGLQYNPKVEILKMYQKKVDDLLSSMENLTSGDMIEKTMKAINLLRAGIREVEQESLAAYLEEGKIVGGAQRSFLEKMHKSKDIYDAVIKPKDAANPNPAPKK